LVVPSLVVPGSVGVPISHKNYANNKNFIQIFNFELMLHLLEVTNCWTQTTSFYC
jgi:hypothetical protein